VREADDLATGDSDWTCRRASHNISACKESVATVQACAMAHGEHALQAAWLAAEHLCLG
jgi:hypothetical protein